MTFHEGIAQMGITRGPNKKSRPLSVGVLKRANIEIESEIRNAFRIFLNDCREFIKGDQIKKQLDDDLKFVSAELGKRKAKFYHNDLT